MLASKYEHKFPVPANVIECLETIMEQGRFTQPLIGSMSFFEL